MNYTFDVGGNITFLGILYLFRNLIVVGVILAVAYIIARYYWNKYQSAQENQTLLEQFKKPTLSEKIKRFLGL